MDYPRPMWDAFGDDAAPGPQPAPGPMPASTPIPAASSANAIGPLPAPAPATPSAAASRRAGGTIVLAGVGLGTGALLGGPWGAGSGLFLAGALSNVYRSSVLWRSDFADDRKEAVKTTVMAILDIGIASYLGYRANAARKDD